MTTAIFDRMKDKESKKQKPVVDKDRKPVDTKTKDKKEDK